MNLMSQVGQPLGWDGMGNWDWTWALWWEFRAQIENEAPLCQEQCHLGEPHRGSGYKPCPITLPFGVLNTL